VTHPTSPEPKSAQRKRIRALLAGLSADEASAASSRACAILREQPVWQQAEAVLFYAALPQELNLSPLITEGLANGKCIALPRFEKETGTYAACRIEHPENGLARGNFGIPEPPEAALALPLNQLDLVLVPGIAFDLGGRRLGRGKGFYDRLLAAVPAAKCGVAFDQQVVSEIAVESHDILMDFILTPTRWLTFGQGVA